MKKLLTMMTVGACMLLSTGLKAMDVLPADPVQPRANYDRYITDVEVTGESIPERIFIMPYRSTDMSASLMDKPSLERGVTVNGLRHAALRSKTKGSLKVTLSEPLLINTSTKDPEVFVGVVRHDGSVTPKTFDREEIAKSLEKNTLRVRWVKGEGSVSGERAKGLYVIDLVAAEK